MQVANEPWCHGLLVYDVHEDASEAVYDANFSLGATAHGLFCQFFEKKFVVGIFWVCKRRVFTYLVECACGIFGLGDGLSGKA